MVQHTVKKPGSRETEVRSQMAGGRGDVLLEHLLTAEELGGKCKSYDRITLKPGCSVGYHQHQGTSEAYYIVSGKGLYNDNGEEKAVEAGDLTFTPDGSWHGMTNDSSEDLVFMALIIFS